MDHILKVDGYNISYSDLGKGHVVIFLHGWGTSKDTYTDLIDILSEKYRCIGIDLPGFGKSDIIDDLTLARISRILNKLIRKIGIKKFYLIGHSLGGAVALVYASRYQVKIDKLVLISPFITFKQFSRSLLYLIVNVIPFLISRILKLKRPNMRAVNAIRIVYYLSSIDLYKVLRKVRKDILFVYGIRDSLLSIKPIEPIFGVLNNIHLAIFEDVRHFIFSFNSRELAEKIDLFFSRDTVQ